MLKLRNIKMENNLIEADYYPESEKVKFGHVSLDIKTKSEKIVMADGYDGEYPRMAIQGLLRTVDELKNHEISEPPKERLVMWY